MPRSARGAIHAERIQLAIARELAEIFRDEIEDPALAGLRVLSVDLSRDGKVARVHVASGDPDARRALDRAAGFLRGRIADALDLERIPELRFAVHPVEAE